MAIEEQDPEQFALVLVECCELLITNGHSSLNPYQYSIKRLLHLVGVHKSFLRDQMMTKIIADHMSRVAIATGDSKEFNNLIDQLSQKE